MRLKCVINDEEYFLVKGVSISEEFNETLDSGAIIISNVPKTNVKPYEMVYIYDLESNYKKYLLINEYHETLLRRESKVNSKNAYKYSITLFSEAKALEMIKCPNLQITLHIDPNTHKLAKKQWTIYHYFKAYLDLYSPKIRVIDSAQYKTWKYVNKYSLDEESIVRVFGGSGGNSETTTDFTEYAKEHSFNNPNLRAVFNWLAQLKDRLIYVEKNVIKSVDISETTTTFDDSKCNNIQSSLSSSDFVSQLKVPYSGALNTTSNTEIIEYMGFRNSSTGLLTLDNLKLESRLPFYKIKQVLLCYYKKILLLVSGETTYREAYFLCKQDITPLVKLESERQLLSQDWSFKDSGVPTDINILSRYKLATVGYSIGGTTIEGWGTKYSYPVASWTNEKTYIENILNYVDGFTPLGIDSFEELKKNLSLNIISYKQVNSGIYNIISPFSTDSNILKGLFFKVTYSSLNNGTVFYGKDEETGFYTQDDNVSTSLPIVETNGILEKKKVNRFGNPVYEFTAKIDDLRYLQDLGSIYTEDVNADKKKNDNIVIYHRDFSMSEDGTINVKYEGTKGYLLKNYYNSVASKYRINSLMSYEESSCRAENKKIYCELGTTAFFEASMLLIKCNNAQKSEFYSVLLSGIFPNKKYTTVGGADWSKKINCGYIFSYGSSAKYETDFASVVTGKSLTFNMKMYDNLSSGNYISKISTDTGTSGNVKGTQQSWYNMTEDNSYGEMNRVVFGVSRYDDSAIDKAFTLADSTDASTQVGTIYNNFLIVKPKTNMDINYGFITNVAYKDNKEYLDLTMQFEYYTLNDNILFSDYFIKLCNFINSDYKNEETYDVLSTYDSYLYATSKVLEADGGNNQPFIYLTSSDISEMRNNYIGNTVSYQVTSTNSYGGSALVWSLETLKSISTDGNTVVFVGTESAYQMDSTGTYVLQGQTTRDFEMTTVVDKYKNNCYTIPNMTATPGTETMTINTPGELFGVNKGKKETVETQERNLYVYYDSRNFTQHDLDKGTMPSNIYTKNSSSAISDIFVLSYNENRYANPCININKNWCESHSANFVSVYYKDTSGNLNFVFGVNTGTGIGSQNKIYKVILSLRNTKDNVVYESQEKQNKIGDIVETSTVDDTTVITKEFYVSNAAKHDIY